MPKFGDMLESIQLEPQRPRQSLTAIVRGIGRVKIYMGADCQLWRWVTKIEFQTTLDSSVCGVGQHTVASTPKEVERFLEIHTQPSTLRDRWIACASARIKAR